MQLASIRRKLALWSTAIVLTLALLGCGVQQQDAMAPPPAMTDGNSAQPAEDEGSVVEAPVIASDEVNKEAEAKARTRARARALAEMEARQRQRAESKDDRSRAAAQLAAERQAREEAESAAAAARKQAEAVGFGSIITNGTGVAKTPTLSIPPIVLQGDGEGPGGMGSSGSGVGGGGYGGLGSFGSGIGGKGYGAGPKGSGGALVGGSARWEVAPFTEEAGWLDDFPELQTSGKDYGSELTQMVKRLLRGRMVNATTGNEVLTPERLEQLVEEGVKYLCDGKLKKLLASNDDKQLELQLVYRLRRVVGGDKFRLVHIRPVSTVADKAEGTLSTAMNELIFEAAQQVVAAVLRDMPADMNAIRG